MEVLLLCYAEFFLHSIGNEEICRIFSQKSFIMGIGRKTSAY